METLMDRVRKTTESKHDQVLYSQLIEPEDYNRIITNEHLYIKNSDIFLKNTIALKAKSAGLSEVVEIGCGPGRILPLISQIENINLSAVDCDGKFISYAKKLTAGLPIRIINANILTYKHNEPVFIFYSQGFHHHMEKGQVTQQYLTNIYEQLLPGGYYIISDEFVPDYTNLYEREINLAIWYSHVIAQALKQGYLQLAHEEAKIFLDDIYEGRKNKKIKTNEQINLILARVTNINAQAIANNLPLAKKTAEELLCQLDDSNSRNTVSDEKLSLSRGDYKICDRAFRQEVTSVGFTVENVKSFGPIETIGGMSVYVLKKTA